MAKNNLKQHSKKDESMEIFKKLFESQFESIDLMKKNEKINNKNDNNTDSDDNEENLLKNTKNTKNTNDGPIIIEYKDQSCAGNINNNLFLKKQKKEYLSSKAPGSKKKKIEKNLKNTQDNQENDEELNVKNDIELQRLISESHLLSESKDSDNLKMGKLRLKAIKNRISYSASLDQNGKIGKNYFAEESGHNKIPMNIRKSINKYRKEKKTKYENDAKEAGIILARSSNKGPLAYAGSSNASSYDSFSPLSSNKVSKPLKRDRGLKVSSVGKYTNRGLVISTKEINKIKRK